MKKSQIYDDNLLRPLLRITNVENDQWFKINGCIDLYIDKQCHDFAFLSEIDHYRIFSQ